MTDNLMRIEAICIDKKTGDVLRALAGLVVEAKAVPIANAEVKNGKVQATSNGEMVSMFVKYLHKKAIKEVNSTITREFCRSVGQPAERYGYLLKKTVEAGYLKRTGSGTRSLYRVQGGK